MSESNATGADTVSETQMPWVGTLTDGGRFDEDTSTALVNNGPVVAHIDDREFQVDEAYVRWTRWGGSSYPWEVARLALRGLLSGGERGEVAYLDLDEAPEWLRAWAVVRRPEDGST